MDDNGRIVVTCACGTKLAAKAALAGQQARCPSCKALIDVPAAPATAECVAPVQIAPETPRVPEAPAIRSTTGPSIQRAFHPFLWAVIGGLVVLVIGLIAFSIWLSKAQETEEALKVVTEAREKVASELARVQKELEGAKSNAVTVAKENEEALAVVNATIATLQAENLQLKRTPQFYFDQAVAAMASSDTDDGDTEAMAAFQQVIDRFPQNLMALEAQKKIADLNSRIAGRARALAKAQAEVRRLIQVCRSNARSAAATRREGLRFNAFNQVDMNVAMDASRRADPLEKRATKAKEGAGNLLNAALDPDGQLKRQIETCDETD